MLEPTQVEHLSVPPLKRISNHYWTNTKKLSNGKHSSLFSPDLQLNTAPTKKLNIKLSNPPSYSANFSRNKHASLFSPYVSNKEEKHWCWWCQIKFYIAVFCQNISADLSTKNITVQIQKTS